MGLVDFLRRYEIRSIRIVPDSDLRGTEISRVDVEFEDGFRVSFKIVAGPAAGAHRFFIALDASNGPKLTATGAECSPDERKLQLQALLAAIHDRVAKAHREQAILNIQPVGKRFRLHGKTEFVVLADDGDGRLRIHIQGREGDEVAAMGANDLLDGLYAAIIEPL